MERRMQVNNNRNQNNPHCLKKIEYEFDWTKNSLQSKYFEVLVL